MFILIDMGGLRFICKHPDQGAVCNFAHIEGAHTATMILDEDAPFDIDKLTDLELHKLYENTTGEKLATYYRPQAIAAVKALLPCLPISDIVPLEVQMQALTIPMGDRGLYQYVKGSYTPARPDGLFTESLRAKAGVLPPAPAPVRRDPAPAVVTTAPKAPSAPRGGNRAIIFGVMDGIWERAGKPTDLTIVLRLRRNAMGELEEGHGIKKTTSSTALGEWQKLRGIA